MAFYQYMTRTLYTKGFSQYMNAGNVLNQSLRTKNVLLRNCSQNLPRLPVPTLQQTVDKFLLTAKPFLKDDEFKKTTETAQHFLSKEAPPLQALLVEKAKTSENWLAEWWLNAAYLDFRSPVVVYSSPGLVFPLQTFKDAEEQRTFTANLVAAAVDYKIKIDSNGIPTDMMGKEPLDMNQYKKVFGTCRIPGLKRDRLEYHSKSKHIVIVCNYNYYKLDVFGIDNNPISISQIKDQLKSISELSQDQGQPIGILTTENRDKWGEAYNCLMCDELNKNSVKDIQSALFLLCLDRGLPNNERNVNHQTIASDLLIHGGGSKLNSPNRWYDKTIQFVVSNDGINGLTYEHSPSEGQPIAVMTDYLVDYIKADKGKSIPDAKYVGVLKPLKFNVTPQLQQHLTEAAKNLDALVCDLDAIGYSFKHFGKEFVKTAKLSPDSFIQIAMQFAFYRLHKTPGAHYESAATRKYLHGRTETIRSCSLESVAFAQAMLAGDKVNDGKKVELLRAAVDAHKKYSVEAVNGFGVDRHLLGLKLMALEKNMEVSGLYKDPGYVKSAHMRLSTSQVATNCDGFMVYGALVADGYGCCYNPRKNDINFGITAFNADQTTSACNFKNALEQSLMDMHDLLAKTTKSKL